jgi:pyruvate-ferredoxin/flavodoxin oxidoreductase
VWESSDTPETAWQRIPAQHRSSCDNNIRVFILPGFDIARAATTNRAAAAHAGQLVPRRVLPGQSHSSSNYGITEEQFHEGGAQAVREEVRPVRRRGGGSNMTVMTEGFARVQEISYGEIDEPDRSSMRNAPVLPDRGRAACSPRPAAARHGRHPMPAGQTRAPFQTLAKFDSEFRAGLGYHQPSGAFASVGVMGAGTGATQSKYVARRETPVYIAENCTQCMECITACPDTALPNTAQEVGTVLRTAAALRARPADRARNCSPNCPRSRNARARA